MGKPYTLTQKSDADALGLTAENNPLLVKHIKDFYRQAPEGCEPHGQVGAMPRAKGRSDPFDKTKKMSEVCSTDEDGVLRRLIEAEGGKLRAIFLSSDAGGASRTGKSGNAPSGWLRSRQPKSWRSGQPIRSMPPSSSSSMDEATRGKTSATSARARATTE